MSGDPAQAGPFNAPVDRALRGRTLAAAAGLALLMLFMGLYAHLRFSQGVGELSYFKAAYDEDTYYVYALMERAPLFYRLLSDQAIVALVRGAGMDHGRVLVLFDALLPMAAALAAYLLAGRVSQRPSVRVLLSLLLVFAPDLLSMGVSPIWDGRWNPTYLRSLVPHGSMLVPDYSTSYLAVLRSPEPQLAWTLLFLHWWLSLGMLGRVQQGRAPTVASIAGLLVINAALAFSYVFVALPALMLGLAMVPVLLWWRAPARTVLTWSLLIAWPVALVAAYLQAQAASNGAASLVFASRLPVVTPAAVLSLALIIAWAVRWWRARRLTLPQAYAAMAGALPLALTNQQLLTGLMVSARDWERYANYPLLTLSAIWLLSALVPQAPGGFRRLRHLPIVLAALLLWTVLPAVRDGYKQWRTSNEESLAIARALDAVPEAHRELPIVLEKVGHASLVQTRIDRGTYIGAYTQLFFDPVPDMRDRPLRQHLEGLRQKHALYEYLFRTGVSPAKFEASLKAEAQARSGYHLAFFFSFIDHWYPASDNRRVRESDILEAIPLIVAEYSALREQVPERWRRPVLFVSSQPTASGGPYELERLSSEAWPHGEAHVQLQRYRAQP